jgi:hypothetical protein
MTDLNVFWEEFGERVSIDEQYPDLIQTRSPDDFLLMIT